MQGETLGLAFIPHGDWSVTAVDEMRAASRKVADRLRQYGFTVVERELLTKQEPVQYNLDLVYEQGSLHYTAKWALRSNELGTFHTGQMGIPHANRAGFYSWEFIGPTVRSAVDRDPQPLLALFSAGSYTDKCGLAIILGGFPSAATVKALLLGCTGGGLLRENCLGNVADLIATSDDPALKDTVSAAFNDPLWLSTVKPEGYLETRPGKRAGIAWMLSELRGK